MRIISRYLYMLVILSGAYSACTPDEEIYKAGKSGSFSFSSDTVTFDTVLTRRGSITKRLVVYNQDKNAISLKVLLAGGVSSAYELVVNGKSNSVFEDIRLLGNDSLLILVKVTIDPADDNTPYLVKDSIQFISGNNQQAVKLVSWGQDAHYIHRKILDCNTVFTADRPYVLSDTILVDTLCELTIEKGAKIYFDNDAILYVRGSIKIEGEADDKVHLRYFRTEDNYQASYGQWQGIIIIPGSTNNIIRHAVIENSFYGLWIYTPDENDIPDVEVSHSIIQHISGFGIYTINSDVFVYNTLINDCLINCVKNTGGGNYTYLHCTLASYPVRSIRRFPVSSFSDFAQLGDDQIIENNMNLNIVNSIIWGNLEEEIELLTNKNKLFLASIYNSLLKSKKDDLNVNDNILNTDPKFEDINNFSFKLDTLSPAKDKGLVFSEMADDLEGKARDAKPDLGAYERTE